MAVLLLQLSELVAFDSSRIRLRPQDAFTKVQRRCGPLPNYFGHLFSYRVYIVYRLNCLSRGDEYHATKGAAAIFVATRMIVTH